MMSKYYTVTLEVSETHNLTLEIPEIEAKSEGEAANIARQIYLNPGRLERQYIIPIHTDVDDKYVVDATAKEEE